MMAAQWASALVVDDNSYARASAAASLRELGFQRIAEADGGAAALACLAASRFDLMLVDWYMPQVDGATVLQRLATVTATRPRVLVMTAYPSEEVVAEARALGAAEILVKPVATEDLALALQRVSPHLSGTSPAETVSKVFL